MDTKPRIFISYSRKDGEDFATTLRKRLETEEPELTLWQDRAKMEGGVGWWKQITSALDAVSFMVLVATPEAIASPIVRKEWRYARQQGVCVYPVQVSGLPLDFAAMPKWMRDSHFYNLDKEWETFVNYLKSPCTIAKVPFMAPDKPEYFVERPAHFDALKKHLLDANFDNPVAITTALRGAGGFGKTTLAAALCHDEDVQTAFDEGVLWVTLGETPNILNALSVLYRALTDENPGFLTIEEASTKLAEKLVDADVLMVIDDVWDTAHLKPFMRGGERCARLVTTRFGNIAVDHNAQLLEVDEMTTDESVNMLLAGIERPADLTPFKALAERLGEWPLMLEITNGMLREEITEGATLADALTFVNDVLNEEGVFGIERDSGEERKRSAKSVLNASLSQLKDDEAAQLSELSIFAEDTDIPTTSVEKLWDLSATATRRLLTRFARGSLIRFDRERGVIRLHDVVREVLDQRLSDAKAIHNRLIENYGDLTHLPDDYAWRSIAYHLKAADRLDKLRELLLNFDYLQNKLNATEVNALIADCDALPDEREVQLVKSALSMSAHVLVNAPEQLPVQLVVRLMSYQETFPKIASLLNPCNEQSYPNMLPTSQTFQPAGGALLRTLEGHTSYVGSVSLSGDYAVSASGDRTLKVWNWQTGEHLRTLEGHTSSVESVSLAGEYAVSASDDYTLKVWNWQTGEHLRTLEGHTLFVRSVLVSRDDAGEYAVSASVDHTLKVWNWQTGEHLRTLEGHTSSVESVALAGEYAVSASSDGTLKVWNWQTGEHIRTLEGHTSSVNHVSLSGEYAVSASGGYFGFDRTLKVWNWQTGELLRTLEGHTSSINHVSLAGEYAVSASSDRTLRVWNWQTGEHIRTLEGHTSSVNHVSLSGDYAISASSDHTLKVWNWKGVDTLSSQTGELHALGERILKRYTSSVNHVSLAGEYAVSASSDRTLKVWNWQTGELLRTLEGHTLSVNHVSLSGEYAVSASNDGTLKVWNWQTDELLHILGDRTLEGHTDWVNCVSLAGEYAISASSDHTLKVWNWHTGELLRTLEGHTDSVRNVSLSGEYAVSASSDRTLKVWNWQSGEHLRTLGERTLEGHTDFVRSVSLSGEYAVSASDDRTLKVWNWQTGKLITTFYAEASMRCVAVAEDASVVAAGDNIGNVHFLRPNAALLKLMRGEES